MAVNSDRSMVNELKTGFVDHTIRLRQGEDRGGPIDEANYYNNLVGRGADIAMTGDFLISDYVKEIIR